MAHRGRGADTWPGAPESSPGRVFVPRVQEPCKVFLWGSRLFVLKVMRVRVSGGQFVLTKASGEGRGCSQLLPRSGPLRGAPSTLAV